MTYVPKPSLSECSKVAKALIAKYPFLNDGIGDGEVCAKVNILVSYTNFFLFLCVCV